MAKERKIAFGLDDIVSMRVRCQNENCSADTFVDLETKSGQAYSVPDECPFCGRPYDDSERLVTPQKFVTLLSELCDSRIDHPVRFIFEMKDDGPERT